ncbi:hypothetical protein GGR50DRAFT_686897 [Xylaria sp. CBS 124048]|nr:hypothetical protein GGR50DRAFT_686897 [Xylaria sp. CBS 124048]
MDHDLSAAVPRSSATNTPNPVVPTASTRAMSETTRSDEPQVYDTEPLEFIMGSNWVLSPKGIHDFYEVLYQRDENLEIIYDTSAHIFKIRCLSHQESSIVTLVTATLNQLAQKERQKGLVSSHIFDYSLIDLEISNRAQDGCAGLIPMDAWLASKSQLDEETKLPDKYLYPRGVALCDFRQTWGIPESYREKGITTDNMFPSSVLSKIQRLTGTTLIASANRCTIYIGAAEVEDIATVKQKLDNLARFFSLAPRHTAQVVETFIHSEGDKSGMGEFRLLADRKEKLLQSYILDRFDWPGSNRYAPIFRKGVVVRLDPANATPNEKPSFSSKATPVIKKAPESEEFNAFKRADWKYPARDARPPGLDLAVVEPQPSPTNHQAELRPKIENWVSTVSTPPGHEYASSSLTNKLVDDNESPSSPQSNIATSRVESEHPVYNNPTSAFKLKPSKFTGPDPFVHLWEECKRLLMVERRGRQNSQNGQFDSEALLAAEMPKPRVTESNERDSRSFHTTMDQRTESRTVPETIHNFDPNTIGTINKSLGNLIFPLTMWPGRIDLRIDLGRFCFLNIKRSHVQELGDDDDDKYYKVEQIRSEINKRHTTHDKLQFTRVLTTLGADANRMVNLIGENGEPMWKHPADKRSSIYEFTCRLKTVNHLELDFIVEIDAFTFAAKVRPFKCDQSCFAVHCPKRTWDFRIVLSTSRDLNDDCTKFAADLAHSLQVRPDVGDRLPELEVSYDVSYNHIEIIAVRTRNTARYCSEPRTGSTCSTQTEPNKDVQRLYISEIWEMNRTSKTEGKQHVRIKFSRYKNKGGHPGLALVWYEAFLKSDTLSNAFKQNKKMELGNEATWTADELLKSGSVDHLVRKAAKMVEKMDGIGFWNDNQQKHLVLKTSSVGSLGTIAADQKRGCFW